MNFAITLDRVKKVHILQLEKTVEQINFAV